MSKHILFSSAMSFLFLFILFTQISCNKNEKPAMTKEEMQKRGAYLVNLAGCNDCHSPKIFTAMGPVPDTTKLLSGHPADSKLLPIDAALVQPGKWYMGSSDMTAWAGPWGVSFTANLTPDEPTGIGTWTEEVFIKALRSGKHMGIGRPLMPPMPWQAIGQSTDEDLKEIFAYLKSLPPVHNKVMDPIPPNQLASVK
ncbi:MAG: diheme cytochrome c-553 [Ignavibacteriaceae bacterium]|nr:diheme cytochrome c-553 [Ignavibacteriaceae bacterium]